MERSDKVVVLSSTSFVVLLVIVIFYFHGIEKEEIDKNLKTTNGAIVRNYKGLRGSWSVEVKFNINDTCYLRDFSSTTWCQNGECLYDSVVLEYSSKDPNAVRMVLFDGEKLYPAIELDGNYVVGCDSVFKPD